MRCDHSFTEVLQKYKILGPILETESLGKYEMR